jgi:hypothetical protein
VCCLVQYYDLKVFQNAADWYTTVDVMLLISLHCYNSQTFYVGVSAPGDRVNWSRKSSWVMAGEHGYKIAKYMDEDRAVYRASRSGRFIGQPQDTFDAAAEVCENNYQIMGDSDD